ncbi:MAG: cytochrome c oxidase subunit 3 [Dehalococcoidia bacterium]|nr:heme-copper oxidase subunit III [Dehalococcoidia bacterium]
MALATPAAGHAADGPAAVGHHPSPAQQMQIRRVGLWLFFFSETFLFGLLFSVRFFLAGTGAEHLNQTLGLAITIILLLSSVSAYTFETAIEHDRRGVAGWALAITILLGLVFAGGVAWEWSIAEFSRGQIFGTAFFTMTGVHAAHVVSGVGLFILVGIQMARGRFGSKDYWPVSGTVMYWHFVDVVWVFYYPALYLVQGVE